MFGRILSFFVAALFVFQPLAAAQHFLAVQDSRSQPMVDDPNLGGWGMG